MTKITKHIPRAVPAKVEAGQFYHRPNKTASDLYILANVDIDGEITRRLISLADGNRFVDKPVTLAVLEQHGFVLLREGSKFTIEV